METPESILRFILQGHKLPPNKAGWAWALNVYEGWVLVNHDFTEKFHTYHDPYNWLEFK